MHSAMLRDYFWLCILELYLVMPGGCYGMPEIKPKSDTCNENTLPLYYHSDP